MLVLPRRFTCCAVLFVFILVSCFVIAATAQDSAPPARKPGVQLEFIPPPMEGTISLGIYNPAGRLVRVLHQEAHLDEFFAALNGLITYWDGKDDSGKMMPAGKYDARGYMAGEMDFEGVAFIGNDWIKKDDSPRITKMLDIKSSPEGNLLLIAQQAGNAYIGVTCDATGGVTAIEPFEQWVARDPGDYDLGLYSFKNTLDPRDLKIPSLSSPVSACSARDGGVWVIDRSPEGTCEVKQFSPQGEFIRRLAIQASDPAPVKIAASPVSDVIFLLEAKSGMQRVRALSLQPKEDTTNGSTSLWKVDFQKTVMASDTLDQVRGFLKMTNGKQFVPQDKIGIRLLPNPLEQDKPGSVDISISVDAKGSLLKAGDGLPLCRVSETPNLRWAAMAREPDSKVLAIFQSDGAVVEQFKAGKLANMVAFDCGDFMFDPASLK
jgi:hypothetical protein